MSRTHLTDLLLAGAPLAALLAAAQRTQAACAVAPLGCQAGAALWSLICASILAVIGGLLAFVAWRMGQSMRRQHRATRLALEPLLARPAIAVPADLAALLRALRVDGRTRVIDLELPLALCHGLLRPRLLLSTGTLRGLSLAEVEAVLRHERAHLHRYDPLRLVIVRALADALPLFPVLEQMAAALPIAQELAADRAVMDAVGAEPLGRALLKVGDGLGPLRGQVVAVGAFSALDARIDQLLGTPVAPPLPSPAALWPLIPLLLASFFLCALLPLLWCVALVPSLRGAGHRRLARVCGASVRQTPVTAGDRWSPSGRSRASARPPRRTTAA